LNIEILIKKLTDFYEIKTITELAEKLGTNQSTISGWRSREALGALVEKINSVNPDLLPYLFEENTNNQKIENNNGQNALNVSGDQNYNPSKATESVDGVTHSLFMEAYRKALNDNDLRGFKIYLMDY